MKTQQGFVSTGLLLAIVFGLTVVGVGVYYVVQQNSQLQTISENSVDSLEISPTNTQTHTPTTTITKTQARPTDYKSFEDIKEGVSFDVLVEWKQSTQPESGYPSVVSPDYSIVAMKLTGAYIAYHIYSAPAEYSGTPDEYLEILKGGRATGWTEMSLAGYKVLARSDVRAQGSQAAPAAGTYTVREVIGRIGNRFIGITFADATGKYNPTFEQFLKSFQIKSVTASTLIPDIIRITAPNGGETLKIGDTVRVSWEAQNVPSKYSGLDLELWQVSGDKPIIDSSGQCSNCTGGDMIALPSGGLENGAGSIDWVVGKKLYPLHTPPVSGNNYVLAAVVERGNTDEESRQNCAMYPSGVCGKPFEVLLGTDYSDRVFTITD